MHVLHEVVEMDAALPRHRGAGEEHVHQHALAAPDLAEDVEPHRRRLGRLGEAEPHAPAALAVSRLIRGERAGEALQLLGGEFLGRVVLQLAAARARRDSARAGLRSRAVPMLPGDGSKGAWTGALLA